jgi:hypothetical protein
VKTTLTRTAKIGLGFLVLGPLTFLLVAIWMKTVRTTLADIQMPMSASVVGTDFTVDYDGPLYDVEVLFDRSLSVDSARCLLGATRETRPDLDCSHTAALLRFSWELSRDGQAAGSGSSINMGSVSTYGGAPRVMIVAFPASKHHKYRLALRFDENANELTIPPPRVQIELDSFVREDVMIAAGVLDTIAAAACLVGVCVLLFSFLKTKL